MILSPFTPLFFISHKTDGIGSDYIQTFSTSDRILIQLIGRLPWSGIAQVFMEPGHKLMYQVKWNEWTINVHFRRDTTRYSLPDLELVKFSELPIMIRFSPKRHSYNIP